VEANRVKGNAPLVDTKPMDGSQWTSSPYDPQTTSPADRGLPPAPAWTLPEARPDVRGWKKFFAIAGIVFGFLVLLTIPGWWGLSVYRQWKAGTRPQPNGLIAWGVIASILCSLLLLAASTGSLSTPAPPTDAYGYTRAMRQGFVAGCAKSGGGDAACNCYFDALERRYSPDEFRAEAARYQQTGSFSDETLQAIRTCL